SSSYSKRSRSWTNSRTSDGSALLAAHPAARIGFVVPRRAYSATMLFLTRTLERCLLRLPRYELPRAGGCWGPGLFLLGRCAAMIDSGRRARRPLAERVADGDHLLRFDLHPALGLDGLGDSPRIGLVAQLDQSVGNRLGALGRPALRFGRRRRGQVSC